MMMMTMTNSTEIFSSPWSFYVWMVATLMLSLVTNSLMNVKMRRTYDVVVITGDLKTGLDSVCVEMHDGENHDDEEYGSVVLEKENAFLVI